MVTAEACLGGERWDSKSALQGQRVLELGCGHGIPGLAALSQGAHVDFQASFCLLGWESTFRPGGADLLGEGGRGGKGGAGPEPLALTWRCAVPGARKLTSILSPAHVPGVTPSPLPPFRLPGLLDLQDYNVEVLKELLLPNVLANWSAWQTRGERGLGQDPPCRCFSGSWTALEALLEREGLVSQYDLVLTSETIYSLDSVPSLLACIQTVRAVSESERVFFLVVVGGKGEGGRGERGGMPWTRMDDACRNAVHGARSSHSFDKVPCFGRL